MEFPLTMFTIYLSGVYAANRGDMEAILDMLDQLQLPRKHKVKRSMKVMVVCNTLADIPRNEYYWRKYGHEPMKVSATKPSQMAWNWPPVFQCDEGPRAKSDKDNRKGSRSLNNFAECNQQERACPSGYFIRSNEWCFDRSRTESGFVRAAVVDKFLYSWAIMWQISVKESSNVRIIILNKCTQLNALSLQMINKNGWGYFLCVEYSKSNRGVITDRMFVKANKERTNLLRALIIRAKRTPYHRALIFFDVYEQCSFPYIPPVLGFIVIRFRFYLRFLQMIEIIGSDLIVNEKRTRPSDGLCD
nr:probable WRKY transcription factor 21 [Tanacetum cinerariifolium]